MSVIIWHVTEVKKWQPAILQLHKIANNFLNCNNIQKYYSNNDYDDDDDANNNNNNNFVFNTRDLYYRG